MTQYDLAIFVLPVKVTIFAFSSSPRLSTPFAHSQSARAGVQRGGGGKGGGAAGDRSEEVAHVITFSASIQTEEQRGEETCERIWAVKGGGKENRKWGFNSSCAHSAHLLQKRYSMNESWACFLFGLPIFFPEQQRGNRRQRWTMVRGDDP